jgi:hypothetical protein
LLFVLRVMVVLLLCMELLRSLRVPVLHVMVVLLLCVCGPSLTPLTPVLASLSLLARPSPFLASSHARGALLVVAKAVAPAACAVA